MKINNLRAVLGLRVLAASIARALAARAGRARSRALLAGVLAVGTIAAAGGSLPASAQQAGAQSQIEEIIVTGSRIARNPNLTNVSPVTAVNSEEFLYAGVTRTEDLLNDLPSIYAAQNAGQANGATGTATVNLRGLSSDRTLVMVNGRRLPPGTPGQGGFAPDLNQVPAALVERVDVLTGGSSATYGSDAVAGVVNFLTVQDFEGFRIDLQSSGYRHRNENNSVQRLLEERRTALAARGDPSAEGYETPSSSVSDGRIDTIALTFGANMEDGRGNLTGYFTYRDVDAVLQGDRDYSRCDLGGANDRCGGSGTIPNGRFTNFGGLSSGVAAIPLPDPSATDGGCPENGMMTSLGTVNMVDAEGMATGVTNDMTSVCILSDDFVYDFIPGVDGNTRTFEQRPGFLLYNYAPTNFFQRPDENTTAGFFFHYDVTDDIEVYSEFNFADNHTQAQIAYSGSFFEQINLACENPLMSAEQRETLCGQLGLGMTDRIGDLDVYTVVMAPGPDGEAGNDDDVPFGLLSQVNDDGAPTGMASTSNGSLFIGKRNVEGGPRSDDLRHTSYRGVLGFRGILPNGWDWDIYALVSEVSLEETYNNDLSVTRINRALDVIPDENGNPICRSVMDGSDPACVPWNLFHGQGLKANLNEGITQAALDYLRIPLYTRGVTEQDVFSGYISGDLDQYGWRVPWADEGMSMALGFETRDVFLHTQPDQGFQSGDGSGQGGPTQPVSGGYDVEEYFGELLVPIVQGQQYIEDLSAEVAYRYSDYSTGNQTDTWKFGASWTPIPDVTFRTTLQRAVRAPHIYELFLPQNNALTNLVDPCAVDARAELGAEAPTLEECVRTGVNPAHYNANIIPTSPAGQYNFLQGGNPQLEPEESDTLSFGVILQPSQVPGLNIVVDYFDIDVEKAIDNITPQTILTKCLDGSATALCSLINRSADNSNLWLGANLGANDPNYGHLVSVQVNLGFLATEGFDIEADYTFDLPEDLGSLRLATKATYVTQWDQEEFEGAGVDDCLGVWSGNCGDPTFELQNNFRATWFTPWDLDATLSWRHISEATSLNPAHVDLDAVNYIDVAAIWRVPHFEGIEVRFGINNLLDEEPPLYGEGSEAFGNGNTFPGYYDALGQYWFVGFSATFE